MESDTSAIPQPSRRLPLLPWRQAIRRRPARIAGEAAGFVLIQAAALWLTLRLVAPTYPIGPLDLQVSLRPSWSGVTEIALPPLGRISARTHAVPVTVSLLSVETRVRSLRGLVNEVTNSRATLRQMERDARRAARALALHLAGIAFLSAAAAAWLIRRHSLRLSFGMGAVGGCLALGGCLCLARGYHPEAFRSARYTGVLSQATAALDMARRGFSNLDKVRTQLSHSARSLARFYSRLETVPATVPGDSLLRVLHVSDLHNSVFGMDLTRSLATEYDVRLIACTGDLTDYGSPLENQILDGWKQIPAPTLFVSGNHDSQATVAALKRLPNARVLERGEIVERLGLRFAGWEDPVSARPGIGDADYAAGDLEALEARIRAALAAGRRPPDVLMLHNYRVAEPLAGLAPIILYGHDHRARVSQTDGSVLVDAGTTGAAGLRYFSMADPPAYTAALLSFQPGAPPRLVSVDQIEVHQPEGGFSIQHLPIE
jgi:predicted phosphodiesterase